MRCAARPPPVPARVRACRGPRLRLGWPCPPTALAELGHVALKNCLLGWHEDLAVGCDRDPHAEAVGVHLAIVIGQAAGEREELLRVGLVAEVRRSDSPHS